MMFAVRAGALELGSDPRIDPNQFMVTEFAAGLAFPTSMVELDDGSLLVLTNVPNAGGNLFDSTGQIVRLVDTNHDGVADGVPSVVHTGLAGIATSMRRLGSLVAVSSQAFDDEQIAFLRLGATPSDALTLEGVIDLQYPPAVIQNHRNVALGVRETPGLPGAHDLFFNIGSETDNDPSTITVVGAGLLGGVPGAAMMSADTIYKVTVVDGGGTLVLSDLTLVATGLRNAAGIVFDPVADVLWFSENGMDSDPASADELNRLDASAIGGAPDDFGFPTSYLEKVTGNVVGGAGVQPFMGFLPVGGNLSEGPVEVALAPANFPPPFRNGLFVGFHGRFNATGLSNDEGAVVWVDRASGDSFHIIEAAQADLGHPDGLLSTHDTLWISDLAASASLFGSAATGRIHRVKSLAPIPALPGAAPALLIVVIAIATFFTRAATCGHKT